MTLEDICQTLTEQNMLYTGESSPSNIRPSPGQALKFPKGRKSGIARRQLQRMQTNDSTGSTPGSPAPAGQAQAKGPFVPPKRYQIHFDREKVRAYLEDWERKGYLKLKPEKLQWTPYVLSRTSQEGGMANDTPALAGASLQAASSSSSSMQHVNGVGSQKEESVGPSLELFSSSPAPAEGPHDADLDADADGEDDVDDELPIPSMGTRSRTKSPKKRKSPVKPTAPPAARVIQAPVAQEEEEDEEGPMVEAVTPQRRRRGRPSANGMIASPPESERPSVRRRATRGATLADNEETPRQQLRSSRSKPYLRVPEPTTSPKKPQGRRRQRPQSPEDPVPPVPELLPVPVQMEKEEEEEQKETEEVATSVLMNGVLETNGHAEPPPFEPPPEANGMVADDSEMHYGSSEYAGASMSEEAVPVFEESSLRSTMIPDEELCDEDAEGEDEEEDADYSS